MNSKTFLLLMLLCTSFIVHAQEPPPPDPKREEKIQALEIAFISRKLELTPEEAQKFWPVFNEYKRDMRGVMMQHRNNPDMDEIEREQKMIDIRKNYRDRFKAVIGQPRMNKLFQAEREFRGVLLNQLKNRPDKPMLQHRKRI